MLTLYNQEKEVEKTQFTCSYKNPETVDLDKQNFLEDESMEVIGEAVEGASRINNNTVEENMKRVEIDSPSFQEEEVVSDDDACLVRAIDIDMDVLLAWQSEELNRDLDRMDNRIVEERKIAREFDRIMDVNAEALRERIVKREKEMRRNGVRANTISQIGSEEIKLLAESLLPRIEEDEKSSTLSYRRKLYQGSNGEQQSLFYKQVWDPFSDHQHGMEILSSAIIVSSNCEFLEIVTRVLTDWYRERGVFDNHYMWNVTLTGINFDQI